MFRMGCGLVTYDRGKRMSAMGAEGHSLRTLVIGVDVAVRIDDLVAA